ncbi:MAG: MBL fold metallo-hydrolase [Ruminococcaceae bacterium]|nr:MBL fold metallo-hydrolase [Oscillospiraceae bacterium]
MKITCLTENYTNNPLLRAEHGLSLYIETHDKKILFDMGQTDLFLQNANTLGVDLSQVDIAILSHGHYDHGGGFSAFRKVNQTAPLYVSPYAFGSFYSDKYIGLPGEISADFLLCPITQNTLLVNGITLYTVKDLPLDKTVGQGLWKKEKDTLVPDTFCHEIYLVIEENGKRILFSGCSHRGITHIAAYFHPDVLIGGFHFKKLDIQKDKDYLVKSAESLAKQTAQYYTCHCTGKEQYTLLKETLGDKLTYLSCGDTIIL